MTREEAIRRIKAWNLETDEWEVLVTIIPELLESEDERIRRQLVDFLEHLYASGKDTSFDNWSKADCSGWIAWLEKQKINTEGDFGRGYDCGYECCLNSHGAEWFEKQKEPKQEWSEADEKMRNRIIGHLSGFFYPNSLYGEDAEECINWLKSLRHLPNWKPTGPEKGALQTAIYVLTEENYPKAAEHLRDILNAFEQMSAYNVGDKISWKGKEYTIDACYPQPKQEWNEEDRRIADRIQMILEFYDRNYPGGGDIESEVPKYIDWLKSLRPE